MGVVLSRIPEKVDLETFQQLYNDYNPLQASPPADVSAVFHKLADDDGVIDRKQVLSLGTASDVYLAHDWGYDELGRSTHDRVKLLNDSYKKEGLITWLDEERESTSTAAMLSPTQLMRRGIRGTQVVMVFITKRYIELVSEDFHESDIAILLKNNSGDSGSVIDLQGSVTEAKEGQEAGANKHSMEEADDDNGIQYDFEYVNGESDDCCANPTKREFLYALKCKVESQTIADSRKREAPYIKAIVPVVMEKCCKDPETWGPVLGPAIGSRLMLDLSDFECPSESLLAAMTHAKKEKEREAMMAKPKKLLSKREQAELELKLKEMARPKNQLDYLLADLDAKLNKAVTFASATVVKSFLLGGPFSVAGAAATDSSVGGIHYAWLRKYCSFTMAQSKYYSTAFVASEVVSTAKLYWWFAQENGRQKVMDKMSIPVEKEEEVRLIEKRLREYITYNITRENQEGIDAAMQREKEEIDAISADERQRRLQERLWCAEFEEDELMRVEDERSRLAWDTAFRNGMWHGYETESKSRHRAAIALDLALRENELMGREASLSNQMRQLERERLKHLDMISKNQSVHTALIVVRDVALKIERQLNVAGPPGESAKENIVSALTTKHTSAINDAAVDGQRQQEKVYLAAAEPKDTDWYRILQETVYVLVMLARMCEHDAEKTALLGELGAAKYICQCLDMECCKITNIFTLRIRARLVQAQVDNGSSAGSHVTSVAPESSAASSSSRSSSSSIKSGAAESADDDASVVSKGPASGASSARTLDQEDDGVMVVLAEEEVEPEPEVEMETLQINIAEAGMAAIRYLANMYRTHPKTQSIDLSGTNERNIYMLGRDGCISLVLSVVHMHLEAAKVRALIKAKLSKIQTNGGRARRSYNLDADKDIQARRRAKKEKHGGMSEDEIARRIIFTALECLYCLASTDFTHPNRTILETHGALETALECCNVLPGDLNVFKWACTLLAMLYSRRVAVGRSNKKICRIMMELLTRHIGDTGIR
jgi:hypothetical protein